MTEKELDYLADKIATRIINKLFDAGDLQISYFPPATDEEVMICLLYTSPSPRDRTRSRMPSSA